jgi:hypothetical protein
MSTYNNPLNVINTILDNGIITPTCCVNCPPCGGRYIFANLGKSLSFFEACGCSMLTECCVNYALDEEAYLTLVDTLGNYGITLPYDEIVDGIYYKYSLCNNGFKEQVEYIKTLMTPLEFSDLVSEGLFEIGTPGGYQSGLTMLLSFYEGNNVYLFTPPVDFFSELLDKGIVFWCDQQNFITASIFTFLQYAESMEVNILDPGCTS